MPRKCLSTEEFIKRSKEIHGETYNYDKTNLITTKMKVIVTCLLHGDFDIMPFNHILNYQGCKKCYNDSRKLTISEINNLLIEKHKNFYKYNPNNNMVINNNIEIICPVHGPFSQKLSYHLRGHGCKKCGVEKSSKSLKLTREEFITKANLVHKNKYNYSQVMYTCSNSKTKIICEIHGEFSQTPASHLMGCGCPYCSNVGNKLKKLTTESFKNKANIIHLHYYNYDKVTYIDSHTKVTITCPIHGDFYQEPASHLYNKSGCPSCNISKGELKIKEILNKNGFDYLTQHKFDKCKFKRKLPFDFYIPSLNTVIEYQGEQHFIPFRFLSKSDGIKKLKNTQIADKIKKKYCEDNNIRLFEITYKENIELKMKELGIN